MGPDNLYLVGWVLVAILFTALGGTVIYAFRLRGRLQPPWSWATCCGYFLALQVVCGLVSLIAVAGQVLNMFVAYAGLKYGSGLRFIPAALMMLALLVVMLALTSLLSYLLGVNLNDVWIDLVPERHRI